MGGIQEDGSIPAWAGEPAVALYLQHLARVYPRVGGGTASHHSPKAFDAGLSPRGRGNRLLTCTYLAIRRSIPAWAGEPYKATPLTT